MTTYCASGFKIQFSDIVYLYDLNGVSPYLYSVSLSTLEWGLETKVTLLNVNYCCASLRSNLVLCAMLNSDL